MRGAHQPAVLFQPRQIGRHRVAARHHGLDAVLALLVGVEHPAQMEVALVGVVARLFGVVEAGAVGLPDFHQGARDRRATVRTEHGTGHDQALARLLGPGQPRLEGRAEPVVRAENVALGKRATLPGEGRPDQQAASQEDCAAAQELTSR
ncbi:hypothetical protein D9M71_684590 [compost metagenome]